MNLCTDSMLFELIDTEKILSVTHLSQDPNISFFHAEAEKLHSNQGSVDEIIPLHPDLVVTDQATNHSARRLLKNLSIRVMTFPHANNLGDYRSNLRRLAGVLNVAPRAEEIIRQIENSVPRQIETPSIRVLVYQPNGFAPGPLSLMGDIIARAGYINASHELGFTYGGFITLESLLMLAPAILIFSERQTSLPSLSETALSHPALSYFAYEDNQHYRSSRISVPENLWTCAGQFNQEAIKILRGIQR